MDTLTKKADILREGATSLVLDEKEFRYFCKFIKDKAGISLTSAKIELVKTRLRKRLQAKAVSTYRQYRELLEGLPKNDPEWQSFINILTTNKTDFFREPKHFNFLIHQFLPAWLKTSEKTLRIWSAASATGEEAYTLSMILHEHLPMDRDYQILASDIDTSVLKKAENAVYPEEKLSEIPSDYQHLIDIGSMSAEGWFRMKHEIKNKVKFMQHNLIESTPPMEQNFDVVFCRNVFIYFSKETIAQVSSKLYHSTRKGGLFMIGHSESLQGVTHQWKPLGPSIFKK